jgi:condensin complex subunit 3
LIIEALESKVATEAASRNALNKLQTSVSKLLSTTLEDSPRGQEKEVNSEEEVAIETTEIPPDAMELDVVDADDLTMLTKPDHEGTVFVDYDEDEEDEEVDVMTGLAKRHVEDSLVESLLDDSDDTVS